MPSLFCNKAVKRVVLRWHPRMIDMYQNIDYTIAYLLAHWRGDEIWSPAANIQISFNNPI